MASWVDKLFVYVGLPSMALYAGVYTYVLLSNPQDHAARREAIIQQAAKYREERKKQERERNNQ